MQSNEIGSSNPFHSVYSYGQTSESSPAYQGANYGGTSTGVAASQAYHPTNPASGVMDDNGQNVGYMATSVLNEAGTSYDAEPTTDVDLSKYPEPIESTKKIRGRSDLIEWFCGTVNRELVIAKAFYLFFFSAFGSLLPLMAIYFKNMGMTPTQAGILIGIRPFVGYLSAPFWADIADRLRKGKIMLMCSLAAWIVFNVPLGFIPTPAKACLVYNKTSDSFFIEAAKVTQERVKRSAGLGEDNWNLLNGHLISLQDSNDSFIPRDLALGYLTTANKDAIHLDDGSKKEAANEMLNLIPWQQLMNSESEVPLQNQRYVRVRRQSSPMKPTHKVGKSPYTLEFAVNYDAELHSNWVSPTFSNTVYDLNDVRKVFFLFLLLIIIGEFFCCPSLTLADSAVLSMLGKENADQYGRQRMFASIGWGLTMFFVCLTLDHSRTFTHHSCQVHERERNYKICYIVFTTFMTCTMIVATKLPFNYPTGTETTPSAQPNPTSTTFSPNANSNYRPWGAPKPPPPPPPGTAPPKASDVMGDALKHLLGKSKVFAQTTRQIPEWMPVLRHFANIKCASFMFVAWLMGFGIGLIFTFLFWHLQDYGGTSTVFGMASVVNHISEVLAYFLSYPLIRKIGHIKVLCLGLIGNVVRFLYISWITEPWGVMPFEFIQGITHSAVWAACCSYIAHNTPQELRVSAQGVLQFIHNGLGRSCGTIFGGLFSTYYGTTAVLQGYGFACLVVLVLFVLVNYYRPDQGGFVASLTPADDPHQVAQEMGHLVPHGVPGNPTIVRTASTANIEEATHSTSHNTQYSTTNGTLDVPMGGATNPFLADNVGHGIADEQYSGISIALPQSSVAYGGTGTTVHGQNSSHYQTGYSNYSGQY